MASADAAGRARLQPEGAGGIFVFNGDADGLVAQHILGLELGPPVLRVTGLKRDIELLGRVPSPVRTPIHVMDVSLRSNLAALIPLLRSEDARITWYDHHDPGEPPAHPGLELHINQAPETCTAVIVNAVHGRRHPLWAAMAAFGDNLPGTGAALADSGGATAAEAALLGRAGLLLNYNAYGEEPGDILFDPAALAARMEPFRDALAFGAESSLFDPLAARLESDRDRFTGLTALAEAPGSAAYLVPDEPFARRYGATWANERTLAEPHRALAVIHPRHDGSFRISIRSPRAPGAASAKSALELAKEFPTGGGRKLAAGVNALPADRLDAFLDRFRAFYGD